MHYCTFKWIGREWFGGDDWIKRVVVIQEGVPKSLLKEAAFVSFDGMVIKSNNRRNEQGMTRGWMRLDRIHPERVWIQYLRSRCGCTVIAAATANAAGHGCKRRYGTAATIWTGTAVVQVVGAMACCCGGCWASVIRCYYVPIRRGCNVLSRAGFFQDSLQLGLGQFLNVFTIRLHRWRGASGELQVGSVAVGAGRWWRRR
jgi:hypothetical protein